MSNQKTKAILFVLSSAFCFALMNAFVRLSGDLPSIQKSFFRNAIALLFAVYRIRTTPFYILDEVEAALDDTNLRRLIAFVESLRGTTQLIMITHQRRTMETADVLFGVSMQADGVTKVISQKLDRALQYAE